ncbi:hypothetical protein [Gemmobacter serpentinus]|uniref:hypothetical protein n=1 Tax=Gemmobacter serpentinus TaxID=2652247 RepID=UPI00124EDE57|nr:hypothetical protein [Gemmobacter serpentinus]
MKRLTSAALAAAFTMFGAGVAQADWPTDRPINLIVSFAPGGGTDIMLRALALNLEADLGSQIPVMNRPGAAGKITYTALSQEPADDYTISSLNTPGFLPRLVSLMLIGMGALVGVPALRRPAAGIETIRVRPGRVITCPSWSSPMRRHIWAL